MRVAGGQEWLVLGVAFDVVSNKGAEWSHLEPLPRGVLEGGRGKQAAEPAALARFVDLGVREGNASVAPPVGGEPDQPPTKPQLVAALFRNVDDLGLRDRPGAGLELIGPRKYSTSCPEASDSRASR